MIVMLACWCIFSCHTVSHKCVMRGEGTSFLLWEVQWIEGGEVEEEGESSLSPSFPPVQL